MYIYIYVHINSITSAPGHRALLLPKTTSFCQCFFLRVMPSELSAGWQQSVLYNGPSLSFPWHRKTKQPGDSLGPLKICLLCFSWLSATLCGALTPQLGSLARQKAAKSLMASGRTKQDVLRALRPWPQAALHCCPPSLCLSSSSRVAFRYSWPAWINFSSRISWGGIKCFPEIRIYYIYCLPIIG